MWKTTYENIKNVSTIDKIIENKNVYESALAVRGWIGAILLVIAGIFLLIGKN